MPSITIRISEYDLALLNDVVKTTGQSKTAVLIDGLRTVANTMRDDERVTWLSVAEFDTFLDQLEKGEQDPKILEARKKIMNFKPVWEE